MPKEECKVASVCKHKERKPKKPHYIPRPFGKPYNYKCFQCPFTCMEKSHLYNHMKYSLCKNSLSLLIESDWPYKKGNLLHSDNLRLQQGVLGSHSPAQEHPEQGAGGEELPGQARSLELSFTDEPEEAETGEKNTDGSVGQSEATEANGMASENPELVEECLRGGAKRPKHEAELVMADAFSLEEQLLRAHSVEVEAKLRHYRLSKTCLSGTTSLLSEQWRILSNQSLTNKAKSESAPNSLPCYPPPLPPGHGDCPDTSSLNLSLLGVGYQLTPGLFSYLNPALGTAAAVTTATSPAQIGALPFLASAAQLTHAHTHTHSDRTLLPPRLYYPFLCEQMPGSTTPATAAGDPVKAAKPSSATVDAPAPTHTPKLNMWKVPALWPPSSQASPTAWGSPNHWTPEIGQRREGKPGWGLEQTKKTIASLESHNAPMEKKPFLLDRATPSASIATDRVLSNGLHAQAGLDEDYFDMISSASPSTGPSLLLGLDRARELMEEKERGIEREGNSVVALLRDLSSALREYQRTEQQVALLPEQRHLWAQLGKIRSDLSHVQQALERTARHSEGPLDLSVKKDPVAMMATGGSFRQGVPGGRKELKDEMCSDTEEEDEAEVEGEGRDTKERRKHSLDMLIKLNHAGVSLVKSAVPMVKAEVLPGGGLDLQAEEAEALWHRTTTKCEADSSVLLCTKTPNHPPSIHHLDAVCSPDNH